MWSSGLTLFFSYLISIAKINEDLSKDEENKVAERDDVKKEIESFNSNRDDINKLIQLRTNWTDEIRVLKKAIDRENRMKLVGWTF